MPRIPLTSAGSVRPTGEVSELDDMTAPPYRVWLEICAPLERRKYLGRLKPRSTPPRVRSTPSHFLSDALGPLQKHSQTSRLRLHEPTATTTEETSAELKRGSDGGDNHGDMFPLLNQLLEDILIKRHH